LIDSLPPGYDLQLVAAIEQNGVLSRTGYTPDDCHNSVIIKSYFLYKEYCGLIDYSSFISATNEIFYRFQWPNNLAITPDLKYIKDPVLNPNEGSVWIAGVRARLAL
jgi:hypothetical protein